MCDIIPRMVEDSPEIKHLVEEFPDPGSEKIPSDGDQDADVVIFKRSHFYAVLVPLAFVVGLGVGFLIWGRGGAIAAAPAARASAAGGPAEEGASLPAAQPAAPTEEAAVRRYDIPVDDDPYLGPRDAPITIVEFSDYECPYCSRFHSETFDQLLATYPDQIRFVYRDFPLASIHGNATAAAEAANCAHSQGAFWDYHDLLFSDIQNLNRTTYLNYAAALGLDMVAFEECIDSGRFAAEVQGDFEFAANLGVRSTPTFFINGLPLVGAQPFEVFKQLIDSELAGEIP